MRLWRFRSSEEKIIKEKLEMCMFVHHFPYTNCQKLLTKVADSAMVRGAREPRRGRPPVVALTSGASAPFDRRRCGCGSACTKQEKRSSVISALAETLCSLPALRLTARGLRPGRQRVIPRSDTDARPPER